MKQIVVLAFVCITGVCRGQFPVNIANSYPYGVSGSYGGEVYDRTSRFVAPMESSSWSNGNDDYPDGAPEVFEDNNSSSENSPWVQGPGKPKKMKGGNGFGNQGNGNWNRGGNGKGNKGGPPFGRGNGNRGNGRDNGNGNGPGRGNGRGPGHGNGNGNGNGRGHGNGKGNGRGHGNGNGNGHGNGNNNGNGNGYGNSNGNENGNDNGQGNKGGPGKGNKGLQRNSEIKYEQYLSSIYPDSDVMDEVTDFIGRELARPGQFPHMGAIGFRNRVLNKTEYKCGASLISELYAVTSAHCTEFHGLPPNYVRFGDLNLRAAEENIDPQTREIARIIKHPQYKDEVLYHDIALIQLSKPVLLTEFVRPIRLWHRDSIPFTNAYAMGFGAVELAGAATNRLTEFYLTIIPNDVCAGLMPKQPNAQMGIIESQICAIDYKKSGTDTFQGDSGGPLQVSFYGQKMGRLHEYLIGITSFGVVGATRLPGVYTRVSTYFDWIEEIVWCDCEQ